MRRKNHFNVCGTFLSYVSLLIFFSFFFFSFTIKILDAIKSDTSASKGIKKNTNTRQRRSWLLISIRRYPYMNNKWHENYVKNSATIMNKYLNLSAATQKRIYNIKVYEQTVWYQWKKKIFESEKKVYILIHSLKIRRSNDCDAVLKKKTHATTMTLIMYSQYQHTASRIRVYHA